MISIKQALNIAETISGSGNYAEADLIMLKSIKNHRKISASRAWLIANQDVLLSRKEFLLFCRDIKRYCSGEPLSYIIGYNEFLNIKIDVDDRVLDPRPDTETLAWTAAQLCTDIIKNNGSCDILELGTGSGVVSLYLALKFDFVDIIALDISKKALELAKFNAKKLALSDRINFLESDWFSILKEDSKFHLILSNPPYLSKMEFRENFDSLQFEPEIALVSPPDGFQALKKIIAGSSRFLHKKGFLLLEHGFRQNKKLAVMFRDKGFKQIQHIKDMSERYRCILGTI